MIYFRSFISARQSLNTTLQSFTELNLKSATYDALEKKRKEMAETSSASFRNEHKNMAKQCGRGFAPILPNDEASLREFEERCDHF